MSMTCSSRSGHMIKGVDVWDDSDCGRPAKLYAVGCLHEHIRQVALCREHAVDDNAMCAACQAAGVLFVPTTTEVQGAVQIREATKR